MVLVSACAADAIPATGAAERLPKRVQVGGKIFQLHPFELRQAAKLLAPQPLHPLEPCSGIRACNSQGCTKRSDCWPAVQAQLQAVTECRVRKGKRQLHIKLVRARSLAASRTYGWMQAKLHIYTYIYIYTHIHTHIYIYTYTYIHMYAHIYTCVHEYAYIYI